jgi:hypothetical protein
MSGTENGKVWAVHSAKIATAAFFRRYSVRGMITLRVERGRKVEHRRGTELHAEAAALTALDCNADETFGH